MVLLVDVWYMWGDAQLCHVLGEFKYLSNYIYFTHDVWYTCFIVKNYGYQKEVHN